VADDTPGHVGSWIVPNLKGSQSDRAATHSGSSILLLNWPVVSSLSLLNHRLMAYTPSG
jgi:hypothetical protein